MNIQMLYVITVFPVNNSLLSPLCVSCEQIIPSNEVTRDKRSTLSYSQPPLTITVQASDVFPLHVQRIFSLCSVAIEKLKVSSVLAQVLANCGLWPSLITSWQRPQLLALPHVLVKQKRDTLRPTERAPFHQQFTPTSQEAKQMKKAKEGKKKKLRQHNSDS